MGRVEADGIDDSFGFGISGKDAVATVMIHGWTEIPTFDRMGSSSLSLFRGDVDEDFGAERGHWRAVEVKGSVYLGVSRQLRIDARRSKEVERDEDLWNHSAPEVKWEFIVASAQNGDPMVGEGLNGSFGSIAAVNVGRCKLPIDVILRHESLQMS